jgi:hypothetical protein
VKPHRAAILVCLTIISAVSCRPEISDRETRYRVARAYGLKAFDQVEQIRFTLNVKKGDRTFRRAWRWHPKTDSVYYNDAIGYCRTDTTLNYITDSAQADRWFMNDQYWLLFPLHLVWDKDITITEDEDPQPLPSGKGRAHRMTVTLGAESGYTPGDVYHLYIGDDDRILAWVYHSGGASEPTAVTTWDDHRHVGPITVSMERTSGPDGDLHVRFSDVAVKLAGMDAWLEAQ